MIAAQKGLRIAKCSTFEAKSRISSILLPPQSSFATALIPRKNRFYGTIDGMSFGVSIYPKTRSYVVGQIIHEGSDLIIVLADTATWLSIVGITLTIPIIAILAWPVVTGELGGLFGVLWASLLGFQVLRFGYDLLSRPDLIDEFYPQMKRQFEDKTLFELSQIELDQFQVPAHLHITRV